MTGRDLHEERRLKGLPSDDDSDNDNDKDSGLVPKPSARNKSFIARFPNGYSNYGNPPPVHYPSQPNPSLKRAANFDPDSVHDLPIQEHELPEFFTKLSDPNSTLEDSKYAPRRFYNKIPSRYAVIGLRRPSNNTGGSVNKLDFPAERPFTRTTVQQEILDKIAVREAREAREAESAASKLATSTFTPTTPPTPNTDKSSNMSTPLEQDVIAKFKVRAEANDKDKENVKIVQAPSAIPKALDPNATEWTYSTDIVSYTAEEGQAQYGQEKDVAHGNEAVEAAKSENTESVTPVKTGVAIDAMATTPVLASTKESTNANASVQSAQATVGDAKMDLVAKTPGLTIKKEEGFTNETSSIVVTSSEDVAHRENATYFASWGTPQARATPRVSAHLSLTSVKIIADIPTGAKVRKVVLRGLPATADLTLVQSIINGGAIDNFALGSNGTAQVTFTTPEACNAYYTKNPNGVVVKYKGRNIVVFVEKTTEVNVISGMLQGQLEAGASRCVRAVGADHDWGMGALVKLAEGKTRKRKVEHIADVWRNEVCRSYSWGTTQANTASDPNDRVPLHLHRRRCHVQEHARPSRGLGGFQHPVHE